MAGFVTCTKCGVTVDPELLALMMMDAKVIVGLGSSTRRRAKSDQACTCAEKERSMFPKTRPAAENNL
jgi:hypothetical protein